MAWRRDPGARPLLAALALLVPAAWFVPEWLGSGDVLRSGARARVPNPGQPALADVPALASLWAAARLLLVPLWIGVVLALREPRARRARGWPAARGSRSSRRWPQAGFSGEPRYALPGVALLAVAGAAGLARAARCARRAALMRGGARGGAAAVGGVPAVPAVAELPRRARRPGAPVGAGARPRRRGARGRRAARRCSPAGGRTSARYRGPLMAYALDVTKRTVEPDARAARARRRLPRAAHRRVRARARRPARRSAPAARVGEWEVLRSCSAN